MRRLLPLPLLVATEPPDIPDTKITPQKMTARLHLYGWPYGKWCKNTVCTLTVGGVVIGAAVGPGLLFSR